MRNQIHQLVNEFESSRNEDNGATISILTFTLCMSVFSLPQLIFVVSPIGTTVPLLIARLCAITLIIISVAHREKFLDFIWRPRNHEGLALLFIILVFGTSLFHTHISQHAVLEYSKILAGVLLYFPLRALIGMPEIRKFGYLAYWATIICCVLILANNLLYIFSANQLNLAEPVLHRHGELFLSIIIWPMLLICRKEIREKTRTIWLLAILISAIVTGENQSSQLALFCGLLVFAVTQIMGRIATIFFIFTTPVLILMLTWWIPLVTQLESAAGSDQRTPDLSTVIQEIIDLPGWNSKNPLAIMVTGTGERSAESFNGKARAAPLPHIEYRLTPMGSAPQKLDIRVSSREDDAEENLSSGSVSLNSSDLELGYSGNRAQMIGMRFVGVDIPQGASITKAYIQFQADESGSTSSSLEFRGQDSNNAARFSVLKRNISSRPLTDAFVSWSPAAWNQVGLEAVSSFFAKGDADVRLDIWLAYIQVINEKFWFGWGFEAWRGIQDAVGENEYLSWHPHNAFIEIWVALGLFGAICFVIFELIILVGIYRLDNTIRPYFLAAFIAANVIAVVSHGWLQVWWIETLFISSILLLPFAEEKNSVSNAL